MFNALLFTFFVVAVRALHVPSCAVTPSHLTVDYVHTDLSSPLPRISDRRNPLLGWWITATDPTARDQLQTSYRIVVATSIALLPHTPDVYDSGVVVSNSSVAVPYTGRALASRLRVYWRVEIWDKAGTPCGFGQETSGWEVPLLDAAAWGGAQWVTRDPPHPAPQPCSFYQNNPAPLFRRPFAMSQDASKVVQARAYVTGLGYYKLYVDGQRVGDAELDPGVTSYNTTILYSVYNLTSLVTSSSSHNHAIGVSLGSGWFDLAPLLFWGSREFRTALAYGDPMFKLLVCIDYADGTTQRVTSSASDGTWRVGASEILQNSIYLGTIVDRRLEPVGWDTVEFNASTWKVPSVVDSSAAGMNATLRSQYVPPVRRISTVLPVGHHSPNPLNIVVDIGKQIAGVCQVCVKGHPGDTILMRYGELLYPATGALNVLTSVAGQIKNGNGGPCAPNIAWQQDTYTLRGDPSGECFTPSYTWHGFRYMEFTGDIQTVNFDNASSIQCYPMRSDIDRTSSFDSSDPLLQKIHDLHVNTQECNLMSIQSDCPHRERLGYGGDALMTAESLIHTFDMTTFYEKRVRDYLDAQRSNGGFTETAPWVGIGDAGLGGGSGPIGWQAFVPVAITWLYKYHANAPLVADAFPAALKFVRFLDAASQSAERYWILNGLGDWMATETKALGVTGLGFQYQCYAAFANMSDVVGNTSLAEKYRAAAASVATDINTMYLDASNGVYRDETSKNKFNATQCGQALPLFLQIVPPNVIESVVSILEENVISNGRHILTGGFGTKYLLMALSDHGLADLAYDVMTQQGFPGFAYMMNGTQNRLTNATTVWESWFTSDNEYSHNHPMFTSAEVYFYQSLGGIQPDNSAVGFDRVLIKPKPPRGLSWVSASVTTVRGVIATHWAYDANGTYRLNITVPPNTLATVFLPSGATFPVGSGHSTFEEHI